MDSSARCLEKPGAGQPPLVRGGEWVVVRLEIFAQLPLDTVVAATDASSLSEAGIYQVNSLCGTHLVADDIEALQAPVHITEVIEPTLQLMNAVNHAAMPGGVGGPATLVQRPARLRAISMTLGIEPASS